MFVFRISGLSRVMLVNPVAHDDCPIVSLALSKKDWSRVSAEDILVHDDPRAAVLVRSPVFLPPLVQS